MAKFKVRLKVTGFELEIEGSRDDVPLITESVGQQFAGMLQPSTNIIEGEIVSPDKTQIPPAPQQDKPKKRTASRRRPTPSPNGGGRAEQQTLEWVHDPSKWGAPQQKWVTSTKAIWLLYVAAHETGATSMSTKLIADTFNKHFQQAKRIQASKVSRDLGRLKVGKDAFVGENTTLEPPAWFLTQAGEVEARRLVAEALGQSNGSNAGDKS